MRLRNAVSRKPICCKCGGKIEANRTGKYGYCKSCHSEYMRVNRPKHSELDDYAKKKANARSYLNQYIRRGKVIKQNCCICGKPAEAHHDDYDKPLEVKWYCREHHLELHNNNKILA